MANIQNLASGSLAENITTSSTTVLVYVGSGSATTIKAVWPTAPFYITVMPNSPTAGVANSLDSEVMKVTAVGNDQVGNVALTVTRAQKGTTARAFNAGSIVTNGIYSDEVCPGYSTSEIETGEKWIDGKTIYKKTVEFGAMPNSTEKTVNHGVSNIDYVVKYEGVAISSSSKNMFMLPFAGTDIGQGVYLLINTTRILIGDGTDRSSYDAYVTMYYTKTS